MKTLIETAFKTAKPIKYSTKKLVSSRGENLEWGEFYFINSEIMEMYSQSLAITFASKHNLFKKSHKKENKQNTIFVLPQSFDFSTKYKVSFYNN